MSKMIPLTQGKFAIVDDEDFEWLNQWKWHIDEGYAIRLITVGKKKQAKIRMHREIIKPPDNLIIDHIDRNPLNNQRSNLRICTFQQNEMNRGLKNTNSSGYIGVHWHKHRNKWQSSIQFNGRRIYLGLFDNPEQAAREHDRAAKQYHGEFAALNFLD